MGELLSNDYIIVALRLTRLNVSISIFHIMCFFSETRFEGKVKRSAELLESISWSPGVVIKVSQLFLH